MGIGSKPCLDIRPSNNQISDRSIPLTQLNKSKFAAAAQGVPLIPSPTAPKLRHTEPGKGSMRRPNSLISESSLSSGTSTTSSSSISGGCSSTHMAHGHEATGRHSLNSLSFGKLTGGSISGSNSCHNTSSNTATLELINETQALKLSHANDGDNNGANPCASSSTSSSTNRASKRHHKRSTTIVSQLSMGIELELCYFF